MIILMVGYLFFDIKKVLTKNELNRNFFQKTVLYFSSLNKEFTNNLANILKEKNINKKSDIQLLINYYNKKSSITIQSSIWEKISAFAITIASFVVIGYNDNTKQIDYDKLAVV